MTTLLFLQTSDWALFFGRFHPILVHFPIGFLLLTAILEILRSLKKTNFSQETSQFLLFFSAISAIFACLAGYFLSLGGGYDEHILQEHQLQGIIVAVLASLAWLFSITPVLSFFYRPVLYFSVLVVFVAGHHGGALTHGSSYLTQNTPEPFRTWAGMPPKTIEKENIKTIENINEALVFEDVIHPILKNKCESCHNAQKAKGDLRMDSIEFLKKGGENGVIFEAGNIQRSELIRRLLLDLEDDKRMPPKGKPQLNNQQIELLKWWIETGASFDKKISELPVNQNIQAMLESFGGGKITIIQKDTSSIDSLKKAEIPQIQFSEEHKILSQNVAQGNPKSILELQNKGGLINPVARNTNFLELNLVNNTNFSDKDAVIFGNLSEQLIWLKLNETQITDLTLQEVAKLENLTRLNLQNTKISNAGLKYLTNLQHLEYLNLVGTNVSDDGLNHLSKLKNLKILYLWHTKTSEKFNLPTVKIERGL